MTETSLVTVGIPTYARGERVLEPLSRVLACTPRPAEIIVHLDGGDAALEQKIAERFPTVRLLSSSSRIGPGGGRHRCLLAATQPYFASFDDDSWPLDADYFKRVATHFEQLPDVAVLAANVVQRGQTPTPSSLKAEMVVGYTGCGHALRVDAYRDIPGYVDRPYAYGLEERDVTLQLHAAGWRLMNCGDLRVYHDTDFSHHEQPEITAATIENAALLPWLRYPFALWPYGFLGYANVIWFLLKERRWAGITSGILRSPIEIWRHRRMRQPLTVAAVISYLRKRNRLSRAFCPRESPSTQTLFMMHAVLIGIVTRNRAGILPKAITSAVAQSGCPIRVSVIDDGSTDATAEVASQFPMVEWIRWESNRGLMAARNHWMSSTAEDYFVSLDDDAWFLRGDEIAMALRHLDDHPSVAAIAFDILSPDQPGTRERGTAQPVAMFIGCGHILRLSAVRAVGNYEPTPGGYGGEEKDLCLRLMDAGHQIVLLPGVHVWHDKTPVARDIPHQHRSGVCNDLVMTLRRTPLPVLPLALLVKMFRHLGFSWRVSLMKPCLAGFALFARSLPAICRSRHPVKLSTLRAFVRLSRVERPPFTLENRNWTGTTG